MGTVKIRMCWSNLLFLALCVNGFLLIPAFSENQWNWGKAISGNGGNLGNGYPESMRLELLHRHGPELTNGQRRKTRFEPVKELLESDNLRQQMISEMFRTRGRRKAADFLGSNSFEMPLFSGAFAGTGQYFVRFLMGTPAQKFVLVADTGSDLTWMNCQYGRYYGSPPRRRRRNRIFNAINSSTFSPIPCSSQTCKTSLPFSLTACPNAAYPCRYDYGYADGSSAQGFYANESATVWLGAGRKMKLHGIVIGCSTTFAGPSFREADGVLGLGQSRNSFAVTAALKFGGKFSYCLVDHLSHRNVSNYLVFGGRNPAGKRRMRYTKLVLDPVIQPFYAVKVAGISVGGELLRIPRMVWEINRKGGVILDSGTSLTVLAEPAYRAVMSALSESLKGFVRVNVSPFEFCFNSWGYAERAAPRLVVHFSGGAQLEPHVKNYVIDVAKGVKCLGFLPAAWPGVSTMGNILQQNFLWEFDLANGRLGFEPSTCAQFQ